MTDVKTEGPSTAAELEHSEVRRLRRALLLYRVLVLVLLAGLSLMLYRRRQAIFDVRAEIHRLHAAMHQ